MTQQQQQSVLWKVPRATVSLPGIELAIKFKIKTTK